MEKNSNKISMGFVLNVSRKFLLVTMLCGLEKKNVSSFYVASKMMKPHQE